MFPLFLLLFFIPKAQCRASIKQTLYVCRNDLQSLVNTIVTDKFFPQLLGYKMHLPQDNICLDNYIKQFR